MSRVTQQLPLRPNPNHRETLPSFLSRFAAINGVGAADFALDMGFSLKRVVGLEDKAISRLSAIGGLSPKQLEELISWTGRSAGDVTKAFRGEVFGSRALWNPIFRGCPVCLREDAEAAPDRPLTRMTMRGDWQLRDVGICVRHNHPMIPLWKHARPTERYDISSRLTEILPDILDGTLELPRVKPSAYDLWLDDRLVSGQDATWLADQSLYAATTFCKLLGTELLRLKQHSDNNEDERQCSAHALGFHVASSGPATIKSAFDDLAFLATGHGDEPKKAFGEIFVKLSRDYIHLEAFTPFRALLRECIVGVWPVAAGQVLLGVAQDRRELHSIYSAADETGISAFLLEQLLINAGAIASHDNRPISRKTFDAEIYAELLADLAAEIPTLVGPIELRTAMGATRQQLTSLAKDGVLIPRIDIPTFKFPWRMKDGLALVNELNAQAVPAEASDQRWEAIQQAKKRSGISIGSIIAEIRNGGLKIGRFTDIPGYAGFCVLKVEIDRKRQSKKDTVERDLMTAATFGRKVGIRNSGWFEALAVAGHTPATRQPHPKWSGERTYVSETDAAAFHARFLTTATMMTEFGGNRQTLLMRLRASEVMPFKPNGEDHGALYLRKEVEAVLRRH